jgi:hypothetical protein
MWVGFIISWFPKFVYWHRAATSSKTHALYCSILLIFGTTAPSGPGPPHSRGF